MSRTTLCILIALLLTVGCQSSPERPGTPAPAAELALDEEDAQTLARSVLESPLTPGFEDEQLIARGTEDGWLSSFWGPSEKRAGLDDGVYRTGASQVEVDLIRGLVHSFSASTIVEFAPLDPPVPEGEMRRTALAFAREFFGFLGPHPEEHLFQDAAHPNVGQHYFHFRLTEGRDEVGSALVAVRPTDGRVVGALGKWRPRLHAEIDRDEAIARVLEHAGATKPFAGQALTATYAHREISDDPFASYGVGLRAAGPDGEPAGATWQFRVDAMTGEVADGWGMIESPEVAARHQGPTGPELTVRDHDPTWAGNDRLVFVSNRRKQDRLAEHRDQLFVAELTTGACRYLTSHSSKPFWAPDASGEDLVALAGWDELVWLSLRTGEWLFQRPPGLSVGPPVLDGAAGQVAYAGSREHGDRNIWVADLRRAEHDPGNVRQVVGLPGRDLHPIFTPDGGHILFDHHRESAGQFTVRSSVRRVRSGISHWASRPEVVLKGAPHIRRLSPFPDGRVLVAHAEGLDVLDPVTGQVAPLELGELRDPDFAGGQPLSPVGEPGGPGSRGGPAVSPDGTRLAFSTRRWSGNLDDPAGFYIYVCNIDGTNLLRVTPLRDEPLPPFVFSDSGQTSLHVSREIAVAMNEANR